MSQQLCCMLQPLACKVMCYILNWQNAEVIKYYEKQFSGFLHLSVQEVEIAIQTLIDNNLIDVSRIDGGWVIQINKDTVKKYLNVKMQTVHDHDVIPLSTNVTWNVEEKKSSSIEDMNEQQIQSMILRLQAQLNEKRQVKKMIKNDAVDDLPF